jgi:hypothetical protein
VEDEQPELAESYPPFEVWRRSIVYAIQHNDGWSVTSGGPTFAPDAIEADQFNCQVADSVITRITMIPVTSSLYEVVDTAI